jgi:hypothetical protein
LLRYGMIAGVIATNPALGKSLAEPFTNAGTANISVTALDAIVDTLIPADDVTPSASALGVTRILLQQAESDAVFRPWLIEGMKWFDQGVTGSFVLRNEDARVQLFEQLANFATGTQPRIFFELLRVRTMTAYYADPRGMTGLAIDRPPQPIGYPDFADV